MGSNTRRRNAAKNNRHKVNNRQEVSNQTQTQGDNSVQDVNLDKSRKVNRPTLTKKAAKQRCGNCCVVVVVLLCVLATSAVYVYNYVDTAPLIAPLREQTRVWIDILQRDFESVRKSFFGETPTSKDTETGREETKDARTKDGTSTDGDTRSGEDDDDGLTTEPAAGQDAAGHEEADEVPKKDEETVKDADRGVDGEVDADDATSEKTRGQRSAASQDNEDSHVHEKKADTHTTESPSAEGSELKSEPPSDTVEKTEQETEPPSETVEKSEQETEPPSETVEKIEQETEPPSETIEKTEQETEPPNETIEKTEQETEPPSETIEKTEQETEPPSESVEKSEQETEPPSETVEKTEQETETPSETIEKTEQKTERPSETVEKTEQEIEPPSETVEKTEQETEPPSDDIDLSEEREPSTDDTDIFDEDGEPPSDNIDDFDEEEESPSDNIDDFDEEGESPSDNIDDFDEEGESPSDNIDDFDKEGESPSDNIDNFDKEGESPSDNIDNFDKEGESPSDNIDDFDKEGESPSDNIDDFDEEGESPSDNIDDFDEEGEPPSDNIEEFDEGGEPPSDDIEDFDEEGEPHKDDIEDFDEEREPPSDKIEDFDKKGEPPSDNIEPSEQTTVPHSGEETYKIPEDKTEHSTDTADEKEFVRDDKRDQTAHPPGGKSVKQETESATVDSKEEMAKSGAPTERYKNAHITNQADFEIREKLDAGDEFLQQKRLKDGRIIFEQLLSLHPQSPRATYGRAFALDLEAEEYKSNALLEQAITEYQRVLDLPDVPKALFIQTGRKCAGRQSFRGWANRAVKTMKKVVAIFPDELDLWNELGVTYLIRGSNEEAREAFHQVLRHRPDDGFAQVHLGFIIKVVDRKYNESIPYLQNGIDSGVPGTIDGRFFTHLGDALYRVGRRVEAQKVYDLGSKKGVFLSPYQRSLHNVDRLTARPWWTTKETGVEKQLQMLAENWKVIRDEGLAQLNDTTGVFQLETEDLRENGEWRQLTLYRQGRKVPENCRKTPKTCELLDQFPEATDCTRGQIKYSVMHPGIHVWPHCGPTNCRIRAHLGLVVPPGLKIRVIDDTRSWTEGKFIVFDDSFDHEVWHEGNSLRLILIVDIWHPELSAREKATLPPI